MRHRGARKNAFLVQSLCLAVYRCLFRSIWQSLKKFWSEAITLNTHGLENFEAVLIKPEKSKFEFQKMVKIKRSPICPSDSHQLKFFKYLNFWRSYGHLYFRPQSQKNQRPLTPSKIKIFEKFQLIWVPRTYWRSFYLYHFWILKQWFFYFYYYSLENCEAMRIKGNGLRPKIFMESSYRHKKAPIDC